MDTSLNYDLFIRKLLLINKFKNVEGLDYGEISFILDSHKDIIKIYDKELLQKIGVMYYETRRGIFI